MGERRIFARAYGALGIGHVATLADVLEDLGAIAGGQRRRDEHARALRAQRRMHTAGDSKPIAAAVINLIGSSACRYCSCGRSGGSRRDRPPMQPADRIQRGGDGAFLPGGQVGGMLSREHDAAVDRAQIVVVLSARLIGPHAEATHA